VAELADGETFEMKGSAAKPYVIKNNGGIYSCDCPAWRNQSAPIDQRTCKHLKKLRGEEAELLRIGNPDPTPRKVVAEGEDEDAGAPVLLAQSWEHHVDLTGWWMSEKLDGVRAFWDGQQFVSRLGNRFQAPDWFRAGLPDHPLDGELWVGRKQFRETISVVRSGAAGERWKKVRFLVFDAPGLELPFEQRLEAVRAIVGPERTPYAEAVVHELCRGVAHLREELGRVEGLGGEGLMLRQPGSRYEIGRSSTLLKVKTFFDAEARVVDHVPGTGKHKGRMGSLLVENADGVRFNVGTGFTDRERTEPPVVGSFITFRYQELSEAGVPRFPSFVALRTDAPPSESPAPAPAPPKAKRTRAKAPAKAATPTAPQTAPTGVPGRRRFELVDGPSSKFWEVEPQGASYTVAYGRIGTPGSHKTRTLGSAADVEQAVAKLVADKIGKGYGETPTLSESG
jgi:DNA ligase-1